MGKSLENQPATAFSAGTFLDEADSVGTGKRRRSRAGLPP
jgi:hypothetical protein